ncbi:hypothetical protein FACS189437_03530 [Bacteroidia bacterium]|nr:hypothetical protein FACS189437_03530 [Bacteroidia bacterium]
MDELFGIRLSQGTIYNILQSIKNASMGMYEEIRSRIERSEVVGADESTQNINGHKHWVWVFQTAHLTYLYPHLSRGKQAIKQHFPHGLPHSCLVTDRYEAYFSLDVKRHQICLAQHKRKTLPWKEIDRKAILKKFQDLLYQTLNHLHKEIQNLQKGLLKHRKHVFNFLFDPQIPYDNNASERAVRPIKVKQKVSGCFRSDQGAMAYAVIHSITDTAKKNKQSQFEALRAIVNQ